VPVSADHAKRGRVNQSQVARHQLAKRGFRTFDHVGIEQCSAVHHLQSNSKIPPNPKTEQKSAGKSWGVRLASASLSGFTLIAATILAPLSNRQAARELEK
jgi:hypothetical protein